MPYEKELASAKKAIIAAGRIVREYYLKGEAGAVSSKGTFDIVTDADKESEQAIRNILLSEFPKHSFIGEEFDDVAGNEFVWHNDPICGTYNFSHGLAQFAISIALSKGNHILLGVIYLPASENLFWAVAGEGAYKDGKKLKVSETSDLKRTLVTTDYDSEPTNRRKHLGLMQKVAESVQYVEVTGSSPYNLCNVAEGKTDGHFEQDVTTPHRLAGMLLVVEAGGKISNFEGKVDIYDNRSLLVTNGKIHNSLRKACNRN